MKPLPILLVLILVSSCHNQDEQPINDSIFGVWQLVGRYDGGSVQPYQALENGYMITFKTDSTLTTEEPTLGCSVDQVDGSFQTRKVEKGAELTMQLNCKDKELRLVFHYGIDAEGYLVTSPKESSCDEGCYTKFKRISTSRASD